MKLFLDTNICIYYLRNTHPAIADQLRVRRPVDIKIPALVAAELRFGAEKSANSVRTNQQIDKFLSTFEIKAFDDACTAQYAHIRADLERKGTAIGPNDLLIAATVVANGGILVTNNINEFSRVAGLPIEDWTR